MNIANCVTSLRLVAVPPLIILVGGRLFDYAALLFAFAIITDGLDGMIARRLNEVTPLGKILDPLSDKLLLVSSFVALTVIRTIPLWITVVVFARDIIIVGGWFLIYLLTGIKNIAPSIPGKITACIEMGLVMTVLFENYNLYSYNIWTQLKPLMLYGTLIFSIISGSGYIIFGLNELKAGKGRQ